MPPPRPRDAKADALRQRGSLNPRPQAVRDPLFAAGEFFDPRDLVQVKYEMLRRVRADGQTVSQSAQTFGLSRPAFYHAQAALEDGGLPALVPKKPGPRRAHKLSAAVMEFLSQALSNEPAPRATELADHVRARFGYAVHPRSIERALKRQEKNGRERRGGRRRPGVRRNRRALRGPSCGPACAVQSSPRSGAAQPVVPARTQRWRRPSAVREAHADRKHVLTAMALHRFDRRKGSS